jgi:hypothetical protein
MKVSICPTLYGQDFLVEASEESTFDYQSRRITRSATLDGGCFIADNGYTASDGTIKVSIEKQNYQPELSALIQQFGMITVSSRYGFFLCAFESIKESKTDYSLNFLIKSQDAQ